MNLIFDTHAHYHDDAFNSDRDSLLARLPNFGVSGVINCSTNLEDAKKALELCSKYNYMFAGVGIHPIYAKNLKANFMQELEDFAKSMRVVCIGEIGLDYYHCPENKEEQKEILEAQIKLAKKLNLPIVIHDRESHKDILHILKKYRPAGVVHCFSGDADMAKELIDIGMYLGFGGMVTFKNEAASMKILNVVPTEKILLETDAPYLAPEPFRKERCDSSFIYYTAKKIAKLKNISIHELLWATKENACDLFGVSF